MKRFIQDLEDRYHYTKEAYGYVSKEHFLSDYIFDFNVYDSDLAQVIAKEMLEVLEVITERRNYRYIKNPEKYRIFINMVNTAFLHDHLNWGASIRGCWLEADEAINSPIGVIQIDRFIPFIKAIIKFSKSQHQ
jgi:hypothetical protein